MPHALTAPFRRLRLPTGRPGTPWHPTALLAVLALWLTTVGNLPLWRAVVQLPESQGVHALFTVSALVGLVGGTTLAGLCALVWPRWLKPVGVVLLLVTAVSSHFMQAYGVVIDPTMLANAVHTDAREVRDLLSADLLLTLLAGVALPGLWWWRQTVRPVGAPRLLAQQLGWGLLGLAVAAVLLWAAFQDVASLMRNHKPLRYMINPFNTVYAAGRHAVGRTAHAQQPLQTLGEDAHLAAPPGGADTAPLIVLVVGETARAANFALGGYGRDTTPRLQALARAGELTYFSGVRSCGTNTQTSVPCMFSGQGRANFDATLHRENLLDVLQRAGLAVLWLDNQSGCKGVCDRVPHASTRERGDPDLCPDGECFDEVLLRALPDELAKLDPARRARSTVVVVHQMGSHGPAYHLRSPAAFKTLGPECTSNALQNCPPEQIVNAYDHSLRYTDHLLAGTIAWLRAQTRPTALLYVSDHGESLGEKGLYLHGMPYAMAPDEQTHVPMLFWTSPGLAQRAGLSTDCLRQQADRPLSHDHLFHSMLGLTGVRTQVRQPELDLFQPCRAPA
ncbi:phosphoethanolamine transferase [Aquabacterium sp. A08]|uniref:phosphoethanolamine transferase n=1 Tax=Aquabacterium sp. A08 TaxID=2718532 RepID=UPI0014245E62|nr:phosphoethanolamine--lipid A transferase [Aquabacterium sp. A08]NIC40033.1 phosphoethanolamine--lipid A transferase [Aquabacterium sp. A08]